MRLRSGELPTFLVTVKPTPGNTSSTGATCIPNAERPARLPRAALKNCERRLRRRNVASAGASAVIRPTALGRELLAAVATATVQNRTAVLGRHTGAETVTAGTHELGRLVSTLHNFQPRNRTVPLLLAPIAHKTYPAGRAERASFVRGVYREKHPPSQRGKALPLALSGRL